MSVNTLPTYSADTAKKTWCNRKKKHSSSVVVEAETQYAAVLLKLHADVTPDDYVSLGSQITAITGIQGVNLLIDGTTGSAIDGQQQRAYVELAVRYEDAE